MTLKFRKDSWHRRLNEWVYETTYDNQRISLCPYFWGTVLAIVLAGPIWFAINILAPAGRGLGRAIQNARDNTIAAFFIGVFVLVMVAVQWLAVSKFGVGVLWGEATIVGLIALAIAGVVALGAFGGYVLLPFVFEPLFDRLHSWGAKRRMRRVAIMKAQLDSGEYVEKPIKVRKVKAPKVHRPRQPSILLAMLKAKKAKVCPYIEWET